MNKKKQEENEMTENDLVSYLEEKVGHLKPYWSHITLGVCLAILAVIGSIYLFAQAQAAEAQKWQDLGIAQQNYSNTLNNESFKLLAEQFPDDQAGLWALLYAADAEVRSGLFDYLSDREAGYDKIKKAQGYYQKILDSKTATTSMLKRRATYGLAYAHESTGNFKEAADLYDQIVESGEDNPFYDVAKRGSDRSNNETLVKLFKDFQEFVPPTDGEAPGIGLPKRPNISFPEPGTQPESGGGDFSTSEDDSEADENNSATESSDN